MTDLPKSKVDLTKDLAKSEEVFRLLVQSVGDYAIFMLDPRGVIVTWNEGAQRIKGYSAEEAIGKHFSLFYTPAANESKHPDYELKVACAEGRYEEEGWRVRKDGSHIWANVVITPIYEDGHLIGFAKVTRDLTERKLANQNEQIFKLLVNSVSDYAIFMLDPFGNVMTWNEGAQRIKGYTAKEIVGTHFSVFYTKESQKRKHPQNELEIARASGSYEEEGWRVRKDGTLIWANVVITAVYDDGKLVGFAKVTRDLTQRLLADQEREMAAKMLDEINTNLQHALEVKSRFLSTISHEVRTPMGGIMGMTELLTLEDLGEDHNVVIASIFDASKRLMQLLNNLLESAQIESGGVALESRSFSPRQICKDVQQLIGVDANRKSVSITGSIDAKIPEFVFGDEVKVRQVLLNLAHNAVKFTDAGTIDISLEFLSLVNDRVRLRFSVSDSGIGVRSEDQERLFDPFVQAEVSTKRIYGGAGLGLSIAKQLVKLMGGTIGVESEYGKGAKFWFELNLRQDQS